MVVNYHQPNIQSYKHEKEQNLTKLQDVVQWYGYDTSSMQDVQGLDSYC